MPGIQTYTQDPLSPARASDVTSPTSYNASPNSASAAISATACYLPARPGAAAPTPTRTVASAPSTGPPPPQPGARPYAPTTTAKANLPPPPKVGERTQPPDFYVPVQRTPTQPKPYPHQPPQSSVRSGPSGFPPGSPTSNSPPRALAFTAPVPPTSPFTSAETSARASLEHPPGYHQNPYASDLTPDQRFATELQGKENRSDSLPSLGYNDNARKRANSIVDDDESVWDAAKKWGTEGMIWGKEKGKQLGDLHERVWDSIGGK